MIDLPEKVDDSVFPRDIAKSLNGLIDLAGRAFEVRLIESRDPRASRFEVSNNKVVLLIPNSIGAGAGNQGAFSLISLDGNGNLILSPGTVNQLMMNDPFVPVTCSVGLTYINLHCATSSYQVNNVTLQASGSPAVPAPALKGAPPLSFDVSIGIVKGTSSALGNSFKYYPVWPVGFNVSAIPKPWIQTDRSSPSPGQTFQETWYSWDAVAAYEPL